MDRQHFRRYDGRVRLHRPAPGAPAAQLPAPAALTSAAYEQEIHAALAAGVPTAPLPRPACLLPPPVRVPLPQPPTNCSLTRQPLSYPPTNRFLIRQPRSYPARSRGPHGARRPHGAARGLRGARGGVLRGRARERCAERRGADRRRLALEARQQLLRPLVRATKDETCPVSMGGGTRRVQSVREGGGGGGTALATA